MKHLLDILAIMLMGDGLSKLVSPVNHSLFYQFDRAPRFYNRFLQAQVKQPRYAVMLGLGMLLSGALLSRWSEKLA